MKKLLIIMAGALTLAACGADKTVSNNSSFDATEWCAAHPEKANTQLCKDTINNAAE